jgi:hypothetical protein
MSVNYTFSSHLGLITDVWQMSDSIAQIWLESLGADCAISAYI